MAGWPEREDQHRAAAYSVPSLLHVGAWHQCQRILSVHLMMNLAVVSDESKDEEYSRTLCTFGDWHCVHTEDSMWLWFLGISWSKWCLMALLKRQGFNSLKPQRTDKKEEKGKERT